VSRAIALFFDNRNALAAWFGWYRKRLATSKTRARVSSATRRVGSSFRIRETIEIETPASFATSTNLAMS
jgi:hypothetical protein